MACRAHPRPGVFHSVKQGLSLVHARAQLEQLQDAFMS